MLESLVSRLTSPPVARRRHTCPAAREVHSEPEEAPPACSRRAKPAKALLDKRRKARLSCADLAAERSSRMDAFKALLPLRQSKSLGRLDGLKEIERLAQYERLAGAGGCGRRRGARLSDLERVQDLFPHDFLALHDHDVLAKQLATNSAQKTKTLRKRPSLDISGSQTTPRASTTAAPRTFIMEAPVTLRALVPEGTPALDRHLFLFSDVLLVAKSRGTNCFKLKESVRLSEAWIALPDGDDTGFLLGWATTAPSAAPVATYLASYPTQAARDAWYRKLQNALNTQLALEPKSTNIQVIYKDPATTVEFCKTVSVAPELTASNVILQALQVLQTGAGEGAGWGAPHEFVLCARTVRDAPPMLLHGIERPHAIQMSRIRQTLSNEDGFDLEHVNAKNNPCGMVFELRKKSSALKSTTSPGVGGRGLRLLLRGAASNKLFGVPLNRLNGGCPPPLVLQMLRRLRTHAPNTHGIFRRSPNLKALKMLREKLDALGGACASCADLEREPVHLLAALVKDFFRSLPQPLLGDYSHWVAVLNLPANEKVAAVKSLLLKLAKPNYIMLTYFMCLLQAIANKHTVNCMCPTNLSVCVGPSLLWTTMSCDKEAKAVPMVIEYLIVKAESLFGRQIGSLLGSGSPDSSTVLLDSGAEESDSLHSVGISLDSMELSSPRKEKLSLSRDSGLTLSEDDSNSNGGNSPAPRNVLHNLSAPAAARMAAERRAADTHNVNGLPQVTSRRYSNKADIYNSAHDEYYAAPYSSERYVHNSIDVGIDRSLAGSDRSSRHEDIYGQAPAKYITGLEPQKPPRTNVSKTARTSKVYSMYSENQESDVTDGNVKSFGRAKSSDNLLDFKQAQYDNKLASSQENILYGTDQNHYGNMDFLTNTNYSRVYTDWEKRSTAYSHSSGRTTRSDNIYGRTGNKSDERKHATLKNGTITPEAATIFTRNDWSRQAARTKSLEVNEDTYVSKCSDEKARGYEAKTSTCHRRQLDPAHLCSPGCTSRAAEIKKILNPLQNSYSYVDNRSSPSSDSKKNRYRCQNGNQKILHSKSLANIVMQSDSSSSDTLYQPQGSPFHPHSADSTASENSYDTHYSAQYTEPLYTSIYGRRRELYRQKPTSNGTDYSNDIYTAKPTSVRVEGEKDEAKIPHHPPPVPPRKVLYQKVIKKSPPINTNKEDSKSCSKSVPPYRDPPVSDAQTQGDVLALDCSDTDTESESYV